MNAVGMVAAQRPEGRKFVDSDLNVELRARANEYLDTYAGTFRFLLDMRGTRARMQRRGRRLSDAQLRGVLNCMLAEADRRAAQPVQVAPVLPAVPSGTFTVVWGNGDRRTIKLTAGFADRPGTQIAKFLSGSDNDHSYTGFATITGRTVQVWRRYAGQDSKVREALDVLLQGEDHVLYGLTYAMESSRCWHCGRTLTVPASIHAGVGPDCAAQLGIARQDGSIHQPVTMPDALARELCAELDGSNDFARRETEQEQAAFASDPDYRQYLASVASGRESE